MTTTAPPSPRPAPAARPAPAHAGAPVPPAARRAAFARLDSAARLARLTEVNLDDLVEALGLTNRPRLARAARTLGRAQARRFARLALAMDAAVGQQGLAAGSAWGLGALATALNVVGRAGVPNQGPLLFVANHPGMTDTIALFAAIARADLRTIAAHRDFLALLTHLSAPLIWVEESQPDGRSALRTAVDHLRAGGAVLTFPGGAIEPDPAVFADLPPALARWNSSIDLFARLVPQAQIVPVLVSGVIAARAAHSPLRRLRRSRAGQDLLSAMLQLAGPMRVTAEVRFGPPISAAALAANGSRAPATAAVVAAMHALLASLPLRQDC